MNLPFEYDRIAVGEFGGTMPTTASFASARVVILPIPLDRTTSYVPGTRNGPHEILVASSHMELWDEETQTDVHRVGIYTMPEMEFPFATMDEVMLEIRRVASELVSRNKFVFVLGGEHSITPAVVAAVAAGHPGLSVLQIGLVDWDLAKNYGVEIALKADVKETLKVLTPALERAISRV